MHLDASLVHLSFKMWVYVFYAALLSNVENSIKCPLLPRSMFKVIIFIHLQWSSFHEERTKIFQEGLLNPSADILEAVTETEAVSTGKIFLPNFLDL